MLQILTHSGVIAIAEARKINLDPIITLMPERCTSEANVYQISFQNEAPGSRIYGILAMPKKPGSILQSSEFRVQVSVHTPAIREQLPRDS